MSGGTIGHRNLTARGLTKATEHAGLHGVTFHVLRHTFASILIAQGHDPVFVSRQLGHANAAITLKVYAHLFDAERHGREAREHLESDYGSLRRDAGSSKPRPGGGAVSRRREASRLAVSRNSGQPALQRARPLSMPSRAVPVDFLNVEAAPASATGGVQQQSTA